MTMTKPYSELQGMITSLNAQLDAAVRELERVKAERDALQTKLRIEHEHHGDPEALSSTAFYLRLQRDKALSALREIERSAAYNSFIKRTALAAIEEIEGQPDPSDDPLSPRGQFDDVIETLPPPRK